MVQNSALKWFWSLRWASGDEKWGLKNAKFHKKVKMVTKEVKFDRKIELTGGIYVTFYAENDGDNDFG